MVSVVSLSAPDSGSSRPRYSSKAARMSWASVALSARAAKRIAISLGPGSDVGLLGQMVVGDEVAEFRRVAVEAEHHVVDGAVALLGHDDLGLAVGLLAKLFPAVVAVTQRFDALLPPLHRLRAGRLLGLPRDEKHHGRGL